MWWALGRLISFLDKICDARDKGVDLPVTGSAADGSTNAIETAKMIPLLDVIVEKRMMPAAVLMAMACCLQMSCSMDRRKN